MRSTLVARKKLDLTDEGVSRAIEKLRELVLEGYSMSLAMKKSGITRGWRLDELVKLHPSYLDILKIARKKINEYDRSIYNAMAVEVDRDDIDRIETGARRTGMSYRYGNK